MMILRSLLVLIPAITASSVPTDGTTGSQPIQPQRQTQTQTHINHRITAENTGDRNDPLRFFGGTNQEPYLDWLETRGGKFQNFIFLDSTAATSEKQLENGAAFHWTIDSNMLQLGLVTRATGWMGFGLSENGGMRGADMMIFEAAFPDRLLDAHVLDDIFKPALDDCMNWELLWSQTSDGFLIVEAQRLVNTNDAQDRAIYNDADLTGVPHLIITAWGETETWQYHGPENRAKGAIRFYGAGGDVLGQFRKAIAEEADGSFFLGADDFAIPADTDTHYQRFCFGPSQLEALGVPVNDEALHIIGIEPVIDPRTTRFIHHFNLMSSDPPSATCDESSDHYEVLYGWAPGGLPLQFPEQLGSPLGMDGFVNYDLEIHYNNPEFEAGFVDSSGVIIYWTREKRQYDIGVFAMADPLTSAAGQSLGEGLTEHSYNCPASCTNLVLPVNQTITILGTSFHMHRQGRKASLAVIRDGEQVFSSAVEFFDFDQAGSIYARQKQQDFQLLPGDSIISTCYYDSPEERTFGFDSQSEMCIASFQYYPRVDLEDQSSLICGYDSGVDECKAEYSFQMLFNTDQMDRTFGYAKSAETGNPPPTCLDIELPVTDGSGGGGSGSGAFSKTGTMTMGLRSMSRLLLPTLFLVVSNFVGL